MSLPIAAAGPLKVEMKPILTVLFWAIAGPTASATGGRGEQCFSHCFLPCPSADLHYFADSAHFGRLAIFMLYFAACRLHTPDGEGGPRACLAQAGCGQNRSKYSRCSHSVTSAWGGVSETPISASLMRQK